MLLTFADALSLTYWDTEMRNRMVNDAFCRMFGVSAESAAGRTVREILPPALADVAVPCFTRALAGEPQQFDDIRVDPSGVTIHAQVTLYPDTVEGRVCGVIAAVTNTTERREAESRSAGIASRLQSTLMASPVGIATLRADGRLQEPNTALARILGRPFADLEGRRLLDLANGLCEPQQRVLLVAFLAGARSAIAIECKLTRPDGSEVAVMISCVPAASSTTDAGTGADSILGIVQMQDVTARTRALEQARRAQARLEQGEAMSNMGTFEWDPRTGRTSNSAGLLSMLGLDGGPEHGHRGSLIDQVHPDDRQRVRTAFVHAVSELTSVSLEFRVTRADGRVRLLDMDADPIVDENGIPVRVIGVVQDVTESTGARRMLNPANLARDTLAREQPAAAAPGAVNATDVPDARHAALSARQAETLEFVAQGLTNGEIAKRMFLSEATVKWHIQQILAKTNSANRTEAVARVFGNPEEGGRRQSGAERGDQRRLGLTFADRVHAPAEQQRRHDADADDEPAAQHE